MKAISLFDNRRSRKNHFSIIINCGKRFISKSSSCEFVEFVGMKNSAEWLYFLMKWKDQLAKCNFCAKVLKCHGIWKEYERNTKNHSQYSKRKYRTSAITSRGLYIFYPISKDNFFVFKEVFSENYVLMYGLYSRAASNQERLMMARVRYLAQVIYPINCPQTW